MLDWSDVTHEPASPDEEAMPTLTFDIDEDTIKLLNDPVSMHSMDAGDAGSISMQDSILKGSLQPTRVDPSSGTSWRLMMELAQQCPQPGGIELRYVFYNTVFTLWWDHSSSLLSTRNYHTYDDSHHLHPVVLFEMSSLQHGQLGHATLHVTNLASSVAVVWIPVTWTHPTLDPIQSLPLRIQHTNDKTLAITTVTSTKLLPATSIIRTQVTSMHMLDTQVNEWQVFFKFIMEVGVELHPNTTTVEFDTTLRQYVSYQASPTVALTSERLAFLAQFDEYVVISPALLESMQDRGVTIQVYRHVGQLKVRIQNSGVPGPQRQTPSTPAEQVDNHDDEVEKISILKLLVKNLTDLDASLTERHLEENSDFTSILAQHESATSRAKDADSNDATIVTSMSALPSPTVEVHAATCLALDVAQEYESCTLVHVDTLPMSKDEETDDGQSTWDNGDFDVNALEIYGSHRSDSGEDLPSATPPQSPTTLKHEDHKDAFTMEPNSTPDGNSDARDSDAFHTRDTIYSVVSEALDNSDHQGGQPQFIRNLDRSVTAYMSPPSAAMYASTSNAPPGVLRTDLFSSRRWTGLGDDIEPCIRLPHAFRFTNRMDGDQPKPTARALFDSETERIAKIMCGNLQQWLDHDSSSDDDDS
ncbi:hypothetical protein DYB32_002585 [Aphanomyces invadans]|uniref:Uncharacterized protein n=1 Tax=Aphanomyces invadans TaxID=157072 RepID=A0A3R6VQ91_9STRA|nr:hypothetical protein DYB32_002585 [Aphanomyces invadans]